MDNRYRLSVPYEESLLIGPDARKVAFRQIYEGYVKRFPLKLMYAYLNWDEESPVDYCVIFTGRNEMDTADLILCDSVPIHSDRSTPCYRYYKKVKKTKRFFNYGIDDMMIIESSKFYEFITHYLQYSLDPKDDLYWKKPICAKELCKGMLDLSLYYTKPEYDDEPPQSK